MTGTAVLHILDHMDFHVQTGADEEMRLVLFIQDFVPAEADDERGAEEMGFCGEGPVPLPDAGQAEAVDPSRGGAFDVVQERNRTAGIDVEDEMHDAQQHPEYRVEQEGFPVRTIEQELKE